MTTERKRGPMDDQFEQGYVPQDEPPGISEHEYARLKAAGGKVLSDAPKEEPAVQWCVLELLGHARFAGKVSEVEMFGGKLGRLDIPQDGGWVTKLFGEKSIYSLTFCDEATARAVAEHCRPEPVHAYEFPALTNREPGRDPHDDDQEYDDRDDEDDAPF